MADNLIFESPSVQTAYRKVAGQDGKVSKRDAAVIIRSVVEDSAVTLEEFADLELIIGMADISGGAKRAFRRFIKKRKRQTAKKLDHRDASVSVANILADKAIAGKVLFTSSGTKVTYQFAMYQAISKLVIEGDIQASSFDYGGEVLRNKDDGGVYESRDNTLTVAREGTALDFQQRVVHEATHAIQDFGNFPIQHRYGEADAYIAGAMVAPRRSTDKLHNAGLEVVEKMVKDKTTVTDPKLYKALLKAIMADKTYRRIGKKSMREKSKALRAEDERLWKEATAAP